MIKLYVYAYDVRYDDARKLSYELQSVSWRKYVIY